jgi:uncharacterized membrane protein (UPF0127 family)/ADP-ribose pyrophosphatase YjhB (NUDIX family)
LNATIAKSRKLQADRAIKTRIAPFKVTRFKGEDISDKTPDEQRAMLEQIVAALGSSGYLPRRATDPEGKRKLLEEIRKGENPMTHEGVILDMDGGQAKIKFRPERTGYFRGLYPPVRPKGRRAGLAGGILASLEPEGDANIRLGTGITEQELADVIKRQKSLQGAPLRIGYQEQFPSGKLRAPSFLGFETDKVAGDMIKIGDSKIHGKGIIATTDVPAGTKLALAVVRLKDTMPFQTRIARHVNHSNEANATLTAEGPELYLTTKAAVAAGDEVTVDYADAWCEMYGFDPGVRLPYMKKRAVIKRDRNTGKYILYTKDGKKILGRHSTVASAKRQERAIQASKHGSESAKPSDVCPKCEKKLGKCSKFAVTDGEGWFHPWCLKKKDRAGKVVEARMVTFDELRKMAEDRHTEKNKAISFAGKSVERSPTQAQQEAGNYAKGHVRLHGLDITIENPKGSVRKGVSRDGKEWKTVMKAAYGYIKRTESDADGDHVDVFLGPYPGCTMVFVIDQVNPKTGDFDEHKCLLGYRSEDEARKGYLENYDKGWKGLKDVRALSMGEFKEWLENGATGRPIAGQFEKFAYGPPTAVQTKVAHVSAAELQNPNPDPTQQRVRILIPTDDGKYLFQNAQADEYAGMTRVPGGGVEPGESPVQAAIRELKEEFGVDVADDMLEYAGHDPRPQFSSNIYYKLLQHQLKPGDYNTDDENDPITITLVPGTDADDNYLGPQLSMLDKQANSAGWHGVDLDGTLATYKGWKGDEYIGRPIKRMYDRIKSWLDKGEQVKIMTTRGGNGDKAKQIVQDWTYAHFGVRLPVTNEKDHLMVDLWDDRAHRVQKNTGTKMAASSVLPESLMDTVNSPGVQNFAAALGISLVRSPDGHRFIDDHSREGRIRKKASMVKEVPMKVVSTTLDRPKAKFVAEVADTPEARTKGLSKRAVLPEGRGMFFDINGPFWMKDVAFPLDLVHLTKSGEILDVQPMRVSLLPDHLKPRYWSMNPKAAYAVELPAGWCQRHAVKAGDRMIIDSGAATS